MAGCVSINATLIRAAAVGNILEVNDLLAKGADVNAKANNGEMALSLAKKKGHDKIARLLKKAGAKEK